MTCRLFQRSSLAFIASAVACAQSGAPPLKFEAASLKPAAPITPGDIGPRMRGGPGSGDPIRFTARQRTVKFLLMEAYNIGAFYISGPREIREGEYDIDAKVPAGATREQFRAMFRSLLEERFQLKLHHEFRETPVYVLLVGANGPKLQKTKSGQAGSDPNNALRWLSSYGRVVFPVSRVSAMTGLLTSELGRPVLDETGLEEKYDITLVYTPMEYKPSGPDDPTDLGPGILQAVGELGLKLEPTKRVVDFLVVDHCAKSPTEN